MAVTDVANPDGLTCGTLRIALMVHAFPVVSETFVTTLAAELLQSRHDLHILATDPEAPRPRRDILGEHQALEARVLRALKAGHLSPSRMLKLARLAPQKAAALACLTLADRVAPSRLAVTRMLATTPDYDVVHAQFGTLGLVAMRHIRLGTLRTRALVVHLRGYDITSHVWQNGTGVYDRLFCEADLLVANCCYFRDKVIKLGCPPEKVIVIGSPIDTDAFAPPASRSWQEGPIRLVAVGRLVEKKGFADAIAAVTLLVAEGRDVTLEILGEGALRPVLEAQIAAAGLAGRVRLLGTATRADVIAALHRADLALAPSVRAASGDEDANVNTAKEAMATGLPVIGTYHGGIPELIIPGENGDLVPERDPQALARAIAAMADAPGRWKALGTAGRRKVLEEFDRKRILEQTLLAYERALVFKRSSG